MPATGSVQVFYKLPPSNDARSGLRTAPSTAATAARNESSPATNPKDSNRAATTPKNIGSGMYAKYTYAASHPLPWAAEIPSTGLTSLAAAADACDADYLCVMIRSPAPGVFLLHAASSPAGVRTIINAEKSSDNIKVDSVRIQQPGQPEAGEMPPVLLSSHLKCRCFFCDGSPHCLSLSEGIPCLNIRLVSFTLFSVVMTDQAASKATADLCTRPSASE
jgi:hypothetical protein